MVYIKSDGSLAESRSWFRISIISDIVFGIANFVWLFVSSLIDPKKPIPKQIKSNKATKSTGDGGSDGGGGGGNMPGSLRGANIHQLKPSNNNCSTGG